MYMYMYIYTHTLTHKQDVSIADRLDLYENRDAAAAGEVFLSHTSHSLSSVSLSLSLSLSLLSPHMWRRICLPHPHMRRRICRFAYLVDPYQTPRSRMCPLYI